MAAINATGLVGAAAITLTLSIIGPGGIIGGVGTLVAADNISDGLAEWGFDTLFTKAVHRLYETGETKESIKRKISEYPLTGKLKAKLYYEVDNLIVA